MMKRSLVGGAGAMRRLARFAALSGFVLSLSPAWQTARAETPVCNPADPNQVRLEISVSGMHSTKGTVFITIYPDQPSHFLDGAYKVGRQVIPVVLPFTKACFVLPEPAYYAVALSHDENNNGHFDTTALGLPAEGFGFSNNPTLYFGPPGLSKVRFPVHRGDNAISIQMKYY
jgi:uncharacterized protein (DUF2141 family)